MDRIISAYLEKYRILYYKISRKLIVVTTLVAKKLVARNF